MPKLFAAKALAKDTLLWNEASAPEVLLSVVSREPIHDDNIILSALTFSESSPAGFFELLKICVIITQLYGTEF